MILEWLPIILALLATGAVAGVMAGLLGVGGGIVIVPVLFLIFQLLGIDPSTAMLIATGTSLATIIPTSISSARSHHKRGNIEWGLIKFWAPFMLIGVVLGSLLAIRSNGLVLSAIFGVVAFLVALNMLFRAGSSAPFAELPHRALQSVLAGCIGFFSVMMGIGGGTLGVPTLTSFNVAAHKAVGTAALFGLVIAVPGAITMLVSGTTPTDAPPGTFGLVNLLGFLVIVPMTVLMAPVGVALGSKLDASRLKKVFALFLIAVSLRMMWQTVAALL